MLRSEFGESARLEDQLQLDDEANSEIADRYTVGRTWHVCKKNTHFRSIK